MKTEPQTKYSLQTIVDEAVERLLDERMALGLSSPESFTAIAQARTRILAALEAAEGTRDEKLRDALAGIAHLGHAAVWDGRRCLCAAHEDARTALANTGVE